MIAYIPARGGSKRIPRKNIKMLDGKPVIGHVIDIIKQLNFIAKICVSTDDPEIQNIAIKHGAATGALRKQELGGDFVGFINLLREDVARFAEADDDLLFVLPTAVLVRENHYREASQLFLRKRPEILMAAVEYPISPFWAMVSKGDEHWQPLHPEAITRRSQDLPKTCVDAGLFYIMQWKQVARYESLMADTLMVYRVPPEIAVDVDVPSDWDRLVLRYQTQRS
jgi:pseudaminic acid cytidylyltransferase